VVVGFLLGVILLSTVFHFYHLFTSRSAQEYFWTASHHISIFNLIYDYQTLIAGLIAVAGAALTIRRMQAQIDQELEIETRQRQRKLRAARAMLPLILTSFVDYARKCGTSASHLLNEAEGNSVIPHEAIKRHSVGLPVSYPLENANDLRGLIEHEGEDNVLVLSELISVSQLIKTNHESLFDPDQHTIIDKNNVYAVLLYCAELDARASAFFGYARSNGRSRPLNFVELIKPAVWSVLGDKNELDTLEEKAQHLVEKGYFADRFSPDRDR
jgi:hypothetical protein